MKMSDLVFTTKNTTRNKQCVLTFDNGYGASIIQGPYSYGGTEGLFEIAVLKNGSLCYDTPITDDVLGNLSEADVEEVVARIKALPE